MPTLLPSVPLPSTMHFTKSLAVAAALALPALASADQTLAPRQYQDPNSQLVIVEPACDFYMCTIYWEPGSQVVVNWLNPPSGDVRIDLMKNNNSDVAYEVATAPAVSQTCDAGAGYGQPGPNGATCGGFVFSVPSSWAAGNYSALRASSIQNADLQSYTDKIYITQNSTTRTDAPLSIVSGSVEATGTASAVASSRASASATSRASSGSAAPTSSPASGSASSAASSTRPSATTSSTPNAASLMSAKNGFVVAGATLALGISLLL